MSSGISYGKRQAVEGRAASADEMSMVAVLPAETVTVEVATASSD